MASPKGRRKPGSPAAGRRRARLADIARILGVSEATVSRALRDDPQISQRTRDLVREVADDLQYVPNLAARSLASRTSRTLGLMIPDVTDPMHGLVVSGFEAVAAEQGYTVIVLNGLRDPERETRGMRELRARQADGVAFCATITDPATAIAATRPGPAVFISPEGASRQRDRSLLAAGCLTTDDEKGMRDLVTHLHATGRTVLSYVGGSGIASDRIRRQAIASTLERLGHEPRLREYAPSRTWEDFTRIVELVERERPEALVCYDDRAALNLMAALRERGVRVPDDVAVTGFDDIPFARIANPTLTTVAQPAVEQGGTAASMLLAAIESGELPMSVTLPVRLVVRESSTPSSAGAPA